MGMPKTLTIASTDAAQAIPDADITSGEGETPTGVLLSVDVAAVRMGIGTAPVAGGTGHLLSPGDKLFLTDIKAVDEIQFISDAAGTPGNVQVSLLY